MKFEDLKVWKKAAHLATDIFLHTENLKNWGFRDQITRAALSISSNIAEGSDRDTAKDLLLFLRYARGSAAETRSQLYIGIKARYIEKEFGFNCVRMTREISSMLFALRQTVRKKIKQNKDKERGEK